MEIKFTTTKKVINCELCGEEEFCCEEESYTKSESFYLCPDCIKHMETLSPSIRADIEERLIGNVI